MKSPIFLNALKAFEAAARHGSFSAASAELNVTPAAVGQLVRGLEDWLGAPLFLRAASGRARLVPTDAARRALPDIQAGFDKLALGMEILRDASHSGVLTVTISPAFAAKWLLPRIERFQAAWPDTDVRLETSHKSVDFLAQGIDIGVRYGAGAWPGLTAEKLLDEEMYPVCSPDYARRHPLAAPRDLAGAALIHDLSLEGVDGATSWDDWLRQAGVPSGARKRGLRINNAAAVLQAASEGQGVALARGVMAQDDLAAGRLVRLFPTIACRSALAYFIVYRAECAASPRLQAFRDWLLAEAARFSKPASSTKATKAAKLAKPARQR
ncbi:transcriptional regulator GcvA [Roseateles chitinivorans]|uniref:transcriptional regulator GcvA n=1 Tax=Roseateles chitinivorans TaxID=2917965 RepID=UPI003D67C7CD